MRSAGCFAAAGSPHPNGCRLSAVASGFGLRASGFWLLASGKPAKWPSCLRPLLLPRFPNFAKGFLLLLPPMVAVVLGVKARRRSAVTRRRRRVSLDPED